MESESPLQSGSDGGLVSVPLTSRSDGALVPAARKSYGVLLPPTPAGQMEP